MTSSTISSPPASAYEVPVEVRMRDLDSLHHVNNAVIITYVEQARTEFLSHLLNLSSLSDINFILARLECDYHHQIQYGSELVIHTWIEQTGTTSATIGYQIRKQRPDQLVAEAETVIVFYDYDEEQTIPVPEPIEKQVSAS